MFPLEINQNELHFDFIQSQIIKKELMINNPTDSPYIYKLRTNSKLKYHVKPYTGVIAPSKS